MIRFDFRPLLVLALFVGQVTPAEAADPILSPDDVVTVTGGSFGVSFSRKTRKAADGKEELYYVAYMSDGEPTFAPVFGRENNLNSYCRIECKLGDCLFPIEFLKPEIAENIRSVDDLPEPAADAPPYPEYTEKLLGETVHMIHHGSFRVTDKVYSKGVAAEFQARDEWTQAVFSFYCRLGASQWNKKSPASITRDNILYNLNGGFEIRSSPAGQQ